MVILAADRTILSGEDHNGYSTAKIIDSNTEAMAMPDYFASWDSMKLTEPTISILEKDATDLRHGG